MLLVELFEPIAEGALDDALEDLYREGDSALEDIAAEYGVDPEKLRAKIGDFRTAKATMANPTPNRLPVVSVSKPKGPKPPSKKALAAIAQIKAEHERRKEADASREKWEAREREKREENKDRKKRIWEKSAWARQSADEYAEMLLDAAKERGFTGFITPGSMATANEVWTGWNGEPEEYQMSRAIKITNGSNIKVGITVTANDVTSQIFDVKRDGLWEVSGHIDYSRGGTWYTFSRRGIDDSFRVGPYGSWPKNPGKLMDKIIEKAMEGINRETE